MKVRLTDQYGEGGHQDIELFEKGGALFIRAEGYGDAVSEDDSGTPVVIELFQGKLRIVAWADINEEDHTHLIELEGARLENREDEAMEG